MTAQTKPNSRRRFFLTLDSQVIDDLNDLASTSRVRPTILAAILLTDAVRGATNEASE
jgi:hypothetical protein